jgi:uncharacterized protein Smg (DUF494 family)
MAVQSEQKEVIIRRSISLKKDEYYLDNKRSNKVDVSMGCQPKQPLS